MSVPSASSSLLSSRNILLFAIWAIALFGTLQVHQWEELFGHAICGPWGCGPPVSALVGYHAFWCLLILLLTVILKIRFCPRTTRYLGICLMLLSAAGIGSLLLFDGLNNSAAEKYLLRWCAFRVVTFVDFPLVQFGLAGLWLRWTARTALKCADTQTDETEDDRRPPT